jgi:hypothetical protein
MSVRRMRCVVCLDRLMVGYLMCDPCGLSYERALERDNTVHDCIRWAAERARRFERKRKNQERP